MWFRSTIPLPLSTRAHYNYLSLNKACAFHSPEAFLHGIFRVLDENHNGVIEATEIAAFISEIISALGALASSLLEDLEAIIDTPLQALLLQAFDSFIAASPNSDDPSKISIGFLYYLCDKNSITSMKYIISIVQSQFLINIIIIAIVYFLLLHPHPHPHPHPHSPPPLSMIFSKGC